MSIGHCPDKVSGARKCLYCKCLPTARRVGQSTIRTKCPPGQVSGDCKSFSRNDFYHNRGVRSDTLPDKVSGQLSGIK